MTRTRKESQLPDSLRVRLTMTNNFKILIVNCHVQNPQSAKSPECVHSEHSQRARIFNISDAYLRVRASDKRNKKPRVKKKKCYRQTQTKIETKIRFCDDNATAKIRLQSQNKLTHANITFT